MLPVVAEAKVSPAAVPDHISSRPPIGLFSYSEVWEDNTVMMNFSISIWNTDLLMDLLETRGPTWAMCHCFSFTIKNFVPFPKSLSTELLLLLQYVGDGSYEGEYTTRETDRTVCMACILCTSL